MSATTVRTPPTGAESVTWREQAACRGTNPALFYDPHPVDVAEAKRICARCPARTACLQHAIDTREEWGVWGGLAADERPVPPAPQRSPGPGPAAQVSDDDLYDLFEGADPDRAALSQLLEHYWLPNATAYKYLERAKRLGVVERRGRGLYPTRR